MSGIGFETIAGMGGGAIVETRKNTVWDTRFSMLDCHLVEGVWYIYDWDTGSSVLI